MYRTGIAVALLLFSGCVSAPKYERPALDIPETFRFAPEGEPQVVAAQDLADLGWWELYQCPGLLELLREGLEANHDLRIAAARMLQAQAAITGAQSGLFPTVTLGAQATAEGTKDPGDNDLPPATQTTTHSQSGGFSLQWELDFWGRIRSLNDAARADFLAAEASRDAVRQGIVAAIAMAYFELRELDNELEIARRTRDSRRDSLRLVQLREERGVASLLEVRQAEVLVYTAEAVIPVLEQRLGQKENELSLLLGRNPGAIDRGEIDNGSHFAPEVPAGLPSTLLERRPDIRAAEQRLIAANARIGAARAAYFPAINLTAAAGLLSPAVAGLFEGPLGTWSVSPSLTQPIFNAGRITSGVRAAKATRDEAIAVYQQAIQQAFREVSDALIAVAKTREYRAQQEALTATLADATRLSALRYQGGVTSYLEVLDSERQYFEAELALAQARRDELLSLVTLYRALGGGWTTPAETPQS